MSIFERYAHYYDSLYEDKDYEAESQYIDNLISNWASEPQSILDVGCGTGQHAALLARTHNLVHGVDQSEEMIKIALDRRENLKPGNSGLLEFTCSDIHDLNLKQSYDVITSLFHVMNYQTSVDAFMSAICAIKAHLKPGGLFIFDSWYGPAVENYEPELRIKRFENETNKIIRIAEPEYFKKKQRVDIKFQMLVLNKLNGTYKEFSERHKIRYLFMDEIKSMLSEVGLEIMLSEEWMTGKPPSKKTWSVTVVAQLNVVGS